MFSGKPRSSSMGEVRLSCEDVLESSASNTDIHENQLSLTHGFFPHQPAVLALPEKFAVWDECSRNLPALVASATERVVLSALPLLDASDPASLPDSCLARASTELGNMAHAYYFNHRKSTDPKEDPLPDAILIPWQQISARIGRRLPAVEGRYKAARTNYDTFLCNAQLINSDLQIDGVQNSKITLADLQLVSPALGNSAENSNNLTIALAEIRFAPAIKLSIDAVKAVADGDDKALLTALLALTRTIESVAGAFDDFSPNEHSASYADQTVWAKTVAKFDGYITGGHPGLSGTQFPVFHMLDSIIERQSFETLFGKSILKSFNALPAHAANFITAFRADIGRYSIDKYVAASGNTMLRNAYQNMLDAYLGLTGIMDTHVKKSYGFLKINFRSGRITTNGGNGGPSTVDSEPQRRIVTEFKAADAERYRGRHAKPLFAHRVVTRKLGAGATEVSLNIAETALQFEPGDHCAVLPKNSPDAVKQFMALYHVDPTLTVEPDKIWKDYLRNELGTTFDGPVSITKILKHADLNLYMKSGESKCYPDKLLPLQARQYSVAELNTAPTTILRLAVGSHEFMQGNQCYYGAASSYLVNGNGKVKIKKISARHFHLPTDPRTPIIMIGSGTGIAPFNSFIQARSQMPDAGIMWLFFTTKDQQSFYYSEELRVHAQNGRLRLSVIFTREQQDHTLRCGSADDAHGYAHIKPGAHIDELIRADSKDLEEVIVKKKGCIYVCGNRLFADSVQGEVERIVGNDGKNTVREMMANHRYCVDDYSTVVQTKFPTFYPSQVAMHNQSNDCWVIYQTSVYNLTEFMHTHPGGRKIIHVNAGRDVTADVEAIGHHRNQQIVSKFETFKVGELQQPEIHDQQLKALYDKWYFFLSAIVEMQNTLINNSTFYLQDDVITPPVYLWREVFSVFVDGQISDFALKEGARGSFKLILGPVLEGLHAMLHEQQPEFIAHMHDKTSEIGRFIRNQSSRYVTRENTEQLYHFYQNVLEHTLALLEEIKRLTQKSLYKLESDPETFKVESLNTTLEKITKVISIYYNKLLTMFASIEKTIEQPAANSIPRRLFALLFSDSFNQLIFPQIAQQGIEAPEHTSAHKNK